MDAHFAVCETSEYYAAVGHAGAQGAALGALYVLEKGELPLDPFSPLEIVPNAGVQHSHFVRGPSVYFQQESPFTEVERVFDQ